MTRAPSIPGRQGASSMSRDAAGRGCVSTWRRGSWEEATKVGGDDDQQGGMTPLSGGEQQRDANKRAALLTGGWGWGRTEETMPLTVQHPKWPGAR